MMKPPSAMVPLVVFLSLLSRILASSTPGKLDLQEEYALSNWHQNRFLRNNEYVRCYNTVLEDVSGDTGCSDETKCVVLTSSGFQEPATNARGNACLPITCDPTQSVTSTYSLTLAFGLADDELLSAFVDADSLMTKASCDPVVSSVSIQSRSNTASESTTTTYTFLIQALLDPAYVSTSGVQQFSVFSGKDQDFAQLFTQLSGVEVVAAGDGNDPNQVVVSPTTTAPITRPPTAGPTANPSRSPSGIPSNVPTKNPSQLPTVSPSTIPTDVVLFNPSGVPSGQPSASRSNAPTTTPSFLPTTTPSTVPTELLSPPVPVDENSSSPVSDPFRPIDVPSTNPTVSPSFFPTARPSFFPTKTPSSKPTDSPSPSPTVSPSFNPTSEPSPSPTASPSSRPTDSPSSSPTGSPVSDPSDVPSSNPTNEPSHNPTDEPSSFPTIGPSYFPTDSPSHSPTNFPSSNPTNLPSSRPTHLPSSNPTDQPSSSPTLGPSKFPTDLPSYNPTDVPSTNPTDAPSQSPTKKSSKVPSSSPSNRPSANPSPGPSDEPSFGPSTSPSSTPSIQPTSTPSVSTSPSVAPTPDDRYDRFHITLVDMGREPAAASYKAAFHEAKIRWEEIIIGELEDVDGSTTNDWFNGQFGGRRYAETIDDIVIGYEMRYIDGRGSALGAAGCSTTSATNNRRCIVGIMIFETVDFNNMDIDDVRVVILHEMGHVLGLVGTVGRCSAHCVTTNRVQYEYGKVGGCPSPSKAVQEYEKLAGDSTPLFLENDGGGGAACSHWEDDIFKNGNSSELMTGFFQAGFYQPISRVSIGALDDLGVFELDYDRADPWPYQPDPERRLWGDGFSPFGAYEHHGASLSGASQLRGNKNNGNGLVDNPGHGPIDNPGGGLQNSPKWPVIKTKTSFHIGELMIDLPLPVDTGHVWQP